MDASTPIFLAGLTERAARGVGHIAGRADACIAASRALARVLELRGHKARLLPCRVAVWNRVWIGHIAETGRSPGSMDEATDLMMRGGWCVALGAGYPDDRDAPFGYRPERNSYNGHMVVVADDRWLLDPTLGQTSDPEHLIVTGPLTTSIDDPRFLQGRAHLASLFVWPPHDRVHITYEAMPNDISFRATDIWDDPAWERISAYVSAA